MLRKKISIGLLFLIPVLTVALFYLIRAQNKPVYSGNSTEIAENAEEKSITQAISVSPTPILPPTISELMVELEWGTKTVDDDRLLLVTNEESALGYYSNLILAERYDSEGKDASGYYRASLNLYHTYDVHFKLASHLIKNGRFQEAESELLLLLPDDEALQALTDLNTSLEAISETYINKKEWRALEELLNPIIKNDTIDNTDIILIKHFARALAEQGDFKRAMPYYKQLYELDPTDFSIAWYYGRCLESTGQTSTALKVYSTLGEKAAYRQGIILQNQGKSMEAAKVYASSNDAEALWRAARIWDAAGMAEKAIETYSRIASTISSYQDDAAYRAYILSKRVGKGDLDKLIDVLSYHPAWMVRIGEEPVVPQLDDVNYQKPEFLKQADIYEKEGYSEAAAIEVAIGSKSTNLEEKLALGNWYMERGEYYNAILWGIRSLSDKPTRKGYELAYPRMFEELVVDASKKYDLEPELVWAIIREESHFRHDAISRAGAMGLMQIMPLTGKDIAMRLGVTITDNDLLNPEININFGTFYIQSMLKMFNGDMDKAMAAYNGGPGNVKKWLESSFMKSDEDFPTAITFLETQEYITKVRNSYHIYKWLYE